MNEQETIDDIVAEMRIFKCRNLETGELESCNSIANYFADRLEAAHKRELDALNEQITDLRQQRDLWNKRAAELVEKCNEQYAKLKQVGDAAKLREAIAKVIEIAEREWDAFRETPAMWEIHEICKAALAEPPRNCDRPECATTKAAQDVWRREDGGKTAYYEWLLATAKEGGKNGNE